MMNGLADAWVWLSGIFEYSLAIFGILATLFFFLAVFSEKNARKFGIIGGACAIWMMLSLVLMTAGDTLWRIQVREMQGIFQLSLSMIFLLSTVFLIKFAFEARNKVDHKEAFYSTLLLACVVCIIGLYLFITCIPIVLGPADISLENLIPMFSLMYPFPIAHVTLTIVPLVLFTVGAYVLKEMKTRRYESGSMQELDKYQKTLSKVDLEISRKIYHVLIVVVLVCYLFVGKIALGSIFGFSLDLPLPVGMIELDPVTNIINPYILDTRAGHLTLLLALAWILIILLFTDAVRIKKYRYYPIKMLAKVYRDKERVVLAPHVYLSAGCLFIVFLSDVIDHFLGVPTSISAQIVIITVMISALADAVATIFGVTKGKHHLKGGKSKKTWEGLIAGFGSAIALSLLSYLVLMSQYGGSITQGVTFSLIGATVFTLIDYYSPPIPISDNILNPLAIGLTLWGVWFLFYF
jgi:dolichol kinase